MICCYCWPAVRSCVPDSRLSTNKKNCWPFVQILNVGNHWVTVCQQHIVATQYCKSVWFPVQVPRWKHLANFHVATGCSCCPSKNIEGPVDWHKEAGVRRWFWPFCHRVCSASVRGWLPGLCDWNQEATSARLRNRFQVGCMTSFLWIPVVSNTPVGNGVVRDITENVYCHCQIPSDNSRRMVECTGCKGWHHSECSCPGNKKSDAISACKH